MLEREPLTETLRILRGLLIGIRDGEFAEGPEQSARVVALVDACIGKATDLELQAGVADPVARLRAAGSNIYALRAALGQRQ